MNGQTRDERAPGREQVVDSLSRAYAQRVDELNEVRERLDRIGEIVMPYLEDAQVALDLDDLKRVLELAEYGVSARARF